MPREIRCPNCRRGFRADERYAGRRFKCRRCGTAIAVPSLGEGKGITPLIIIQAWLGVVFAVMAGISLPMSVAELIHDGEIRILDHAYIVATCVLALVSGTFFWLAIRNTRRSNSRSGRISGSKSFRP